MGAPWERSHRGASAACRFGLMGKDFEYYMEDDSSMTDILQSDDRLMPDTRVQGSRKVANRSMFFRRWLANPLQMGSIVPSSATLCRHIVAQTQYRPNEVVVELGAGTGVVSRALLAGGVPADRLIVVEIVPDMVDHLRRVLPGVLVIQGDARQLSDLIPEHCQGHIGTVICGIPLVLLPRDEQRRFHRRDRRGRARQGVPAFQLLRHVPAALSASPPGGQAGSLDTAEFPARERVALHAVGLTGHATWRISTTGNHFWMACSGCGRSK